MRSTATTADAIKLFTEGSIALTQVEAAGMRVDVPYLDRTLIEVVGDKRRLEDELKQDDMFRVWKREFGGAANLGSLEQLSHVLFNVMELPNQGYTAGSAGKTKKRFK